MKFLFVDESKKQGKDNSKEAFVLAGIMVDSKKITLIENALEEVKGRYGINKIEDIKKIPEKEARLAFSVEVRDILYDHGCKVLSAIQGEVSLDNYEKIEEVYPDCFHFLLERFFINLNMETPPKCGLIIHDFFGKPYGNEFIKKIYEKIKNENFSPYWTKKKTPYKERVYPQIFFGKDDYSNLLQASDVIATTLNHTYIQMKSELEEGELHKIKEKIEEFKDKNEYLSIYWSLFVKNPRDGDVSGYGIKIWI